MTPPHRFTVRGNRNGSHVHITWTEGVLTGDPPTVDLVELEAEIAVLNPDDPNSVAKVFYADDGLSDNPLSDASSAWRLIRRVFDSVTHVEGDVPLEALEPRPRP